MKSLFLIPTLLFAAPALAGELSIGVAGGIIKTDPLQVIGTTWTVVPRVGYFINDTIGVELDVGVLAGKTRFGDENYPYFGLTPRLNVIGKIWTKGGKKKDGSEGRKPFIHPTLSAGLGGMYTSVNDEDVLGKDFNRNDLDFMINGGPGLWLPLGPAHFRTDMRWMVTMGNENFQNRGDQFVNWEWTAGFGISFGGKSDKDKDGILDGDDKCVDEAEDMDNFEDEDGCPEKDNDNDGLMDADDTCPNEAEDKDSIADEDGCPEDDHDEDGVLDDEDSCPLEAGTKETKGCPDGDGDGVSDEDDECDDEAGSIEAWGCLDDDDDHVPNWRDQCPDEPAAKRVSSKYSDGCPHRVIVTDSSVAILEKIQFDVGKATIKEESFGLLEEVAKTLKQFGNIRKVSVEGHTDNTGEPEQNMTLSDNRAKAVRQHLMDTHDIEAERLEAKGFGQTKPLEGVDAESEEGRAKNRRVEFNITDFDKKASPVLKRVTLKLQPYEVDFETDKLTVKTAQIPSATAITGTHSCVAIVKIGTEGKITDIKMSICAGMPRSIARRSMKTWEFEPIKVDDKATVHQATFKWDFKGAETSVTIDPKSIVPDE